MDQIVTYRFKNFKRDYEATNIKFIQQPESMSIDLEFWEVCDEDEIDCNQLWIEGGVKRVFGYI